MQVVQRQKHSRVGNGPGYLALEHSAFHLNLGKLSMPSSTQLISAQTLHDMLTAGGVDVLVCDCRSDLVDLAAGARAFAQSHIPGARYVDLTTELSAPKTGTNGRHPLPVITEFVAAMLDWGVNDQTVLVAYDSHGGLYGSRLWWLARAAGHTRVMVLDGGLPAWMAAGYTVTSEPPPARARGNFKQKTSLVAAVDVVNVRAGLSNADRILVDARPGDRFQGQNETLDRLAGHIPGAVSRPVKENLRENGLFKDAGTLRAEFTRLLGQHKPYQLVASCGSGVSACHLLLAMELAGLPGGALYGGSWSEWSAQPDALVETGPGRLN